MKLSKFTVAYGLYIIISASFMQQVWEFLEKIFGKPNLTAGAISLSFLIAILILSYIIKIHFSLWRIFVNLGIMGLGFIFAWRQPYFVEKMHVLEYGFLGWLSTRDLNKSRGLIKVILLAILFVFLISALDEGFQKLLPYRVGDVRDVITNVISGSFGVILFLIK